MMMYKDKNDEILKVGDKLKHIKGEIRQIVNVCGVCVLALKKDNEKPSTPDNILETKVFKKVDLSEWEKVA